MGGVRVCLHKYCQSSKGNMSSAGLQQCSHNTITRELPPAGYFDCKKPPSLLALPVLSQAAQPGLDIESSISIPRRLLIFTINFGSYDLAPAYNCRGLWRRMSHRFQAKFSVTCLLVTDERKIAIMAGRLGWDSVVLHPLSMPKRMQRSLKILQELPSLKGFDFVLYHDGKCGPFGSDRAKRPKNEFGDTLYPQDACLFEKRLTAALEVLRDGNPHELVAFSHSSRNTTADEFEAVATQRLCANRSLGLIRAKLSLDEFPDRSGLADTSVIIQRFRNGVRTASLEATMQAWWSEMRSAKCMRDQLSFMYVLWKSNISYTLLPDDLRPLVKVRKHIDQHNHRANWKV